ncbi:MAG: alpha/beta hydrolase [Gammaproteobacteria bacterium]|nr:alpha/beta hydrolase [Gammaproteobacteria bacterium]MCW9055032.1 alpha/beta hydrolase [Gammaproteobacteria bacterium]
MKFLANLSLWLVYGLLFVSLSGCTHLMFVPMAKLVRTPDQVGVEYKDILISGQDGVVLHGWYLPATVETKGSVLFFHGNGENISTHLATVYWLPEQGYEVFMVDYRGYGQSGGDVDLAGSLSDVNVSIEYAVENKKSNKGLIVFGHSLGASLSIYSVANSEYKDQINALISIGAFSDYRKIVQDALSKSWLTWAFQWPLSFTVNNDYAPEDYVIDISPVPLVIMHSPEDQIVPYYHSELLYKVAKQPKFFEKLEGDHNHTFEYENNRLILLEYLSRFVQ